MIMKIALVSLMAVSLTACQINPTYSPTTGARAMLFGANKDYKWSLISDPTKKASSPTVERFELRPGDCIGIDCNRGSIGTYSERVQRWIASRSTGALNTTVWYGIDFYVSGDYVDAVSSVPNDWKTYGITTIFDIKPGIFDKSNAIREGGDGDVIVGLNAGWNGLEFKIWDAPSNQPGGSMYSSKNLPKWDVLVDKWNRVEVELKLSRKEDGVVRLYLNGELKDEYLGPNYKQSSKGGKIEYGKFKYGIYTFFKNSSDWKELRKNPKKYSPPTRVIMFDNPSVAKTRNELFNNLD